MKKNFPVTGREKEYPADIHIVSTTDTKGIIRHANEDFVEVCGFSREELLGRNHNIVRHPDMPPAAFANLWADLKAGKSWMGIVKNRAKNGDHYWVDAYVMPMIEDGKVTGYQSVRVRPDRERVRRAEALYRDLNRGRTGWRRYLDRALGGMQRRLVLGQLLVWMPVLGICGLGGAGLSALGLAAGVGLLGSLGIATVQARPWQKAAREARTLFHNPVAREVYTGRSDELGDLQLALEALKARSRTLVWRLADATGELEGIATDVASVVASTGNSVEYQQSEIDQVSTAMQEMSATVQQVAANTVTTAAATEKVDTDAASCQCALERGASGMERLAQGVDEAVEVIQRLLGDTERIGSVVDVIRGVAEQTNLLALNAAIEAARAGEQGRGFAVVADEVRTLAGRTQGSTEEIKTVIERLQETVAEAAEVMAQSRKIAAAGQKEVQSAKERLETLRTDIANITQMTAEIATAAEEQSAVSEEIHRNLVNINRVAEQNAGRARESMTNSAGLTAEVARLRVMVSQFD